MACKAGMPVLKKRLQEKLQTLRQCEDDLSTSASARRVQQDTFMRQKGTILSQICAEFDRLSAALEKKRNEVTSAVENEMDDIYQKSTGDCRNTEELQERVDTCLQDAQGLLSCVDRSSFLSTYSSINQRVEDVLLEVLLALETDETVMDPQTTEQTSFQLKFSLAAVAQLLLATKASVNMVSRKQETPSSPRPSLRNGVGDSAMVGDGTRTSAVPQAPKGQEKCEGNKVTSSATYPPSPHLPRASQPQGNRGTAVFSSVKSLPSPSLPTQQPNMGNKMAAPQLKQLQLKIHSKLQVLVTEVWSLEQFWVQPLTHDLEKLTNDMREYFSMHKTGRKDLYSTPTSTPTRGSYCCAQFTADDEWYRARVLDIGKPTPHCAPLMKMFYVDYGNRELLPLNRLHPLPEHLCSLPMQAISCSLANAEEASVSRRAISWFQEYFPGQVATIEVVELATQFCYLVQCQVAPTHLEGLDAATANQLRDKDLVDVLYVLECMSVNAGVAGKRAPSLEETTPSSLHHSPTKGAAPYVVTMRNESTSLQGESRTANPFDTLPANPGNVASVAVKETSSQESPVVSATVSAMPGPVAQIPSTSQSSTNSQHQGEDALTQNCDRNAEEVDVPEDGSVHSGDLLEESSVDLNTSGTELSLDLPPNVASRDENDVRQTGSCGSFLSASVEDARMDLSSSSSSCAKDTSFQAPPTLGDLNVRRIPVEGNSFALIVANIISPSLFYAHVVSPDSSDLDLLQQQINHFYGAPDSSVLLGCPPLSSNTSQEEGEAVKDRKSGNVGGGLSFEVGGVCAAKLPEDDCWYRGVVIGVREGEEEGMAEELGGDDGARGEVRGKEGVTEDKGEEEGMAEENGEGEEAREGAEGKEGVTEEKGEKERIAEQKRPEEVLTEEQEEEERMAEASGEGKEEGTAEELGGGEGVTEEVEEEAGVTEDMGENEGTAEKMRQGEGVTEAKEGMAGEEGVTEEKREEEATEEKEQVTEEEREMVEVEGREEGEREKMSSKGAYRGTQYHIHYLDYGDAAWVDADQVRPLHKQFLGTPVQTVRLSLVGVSPAIAPPTPPSHSSGMDMAEMQPVKAAKKRTMNRSRSKMSCNLLPAGGEPEEDGFHGRFELRSPSDSQLRDFPMTSLQVGVHYSSAPDVRQRLQRSCSNVSDVSDGLNHSFCSTEEEEAVMWSKEATATFKDLAGEQVLLAMLLEEDILACSSPDSQTIKLSSVMDVLPVMLYDTTTDMDVFINAVLVERGLARIDGAALSADADSTQPLTPTSPGLEDWDPLKKHYLTQSNDYERSLAAQSEKRVEICRHFNSKRGCSRGSRCSYLHVPIGPYSEAKSLECASPNVRLYQALPPPHTWVAVEVITVVTPYSFYVHFPIGTTSLLEQQTAAPSVYGGRGYEGYLWTFEQLRKDMNVRYSKSLQQRRQGSLPAVGELVAVCYSGDGNWYRALVLKTTSATNDVAVFYVDFGNSEEVPECEVRSLHSEFMHLPYQAVECRLADVSAVTESVEGTSLEDAWKEGITALTELVKDRVLVAEVIRPFSVAGIEVELYDTADAHCDILIHRKMVELGHLLPSSSSSSSSSASLHPSSKAPFVSSPKPSRRGNYAKAPVMLPG